MLEYSEIRTGKIIVYEGEPCEVVDNHVARTQMRKPQNQVKLKSLLSGRTWNATFHASEKVEEADIIKRDVKFIYTNRGEYWFCDPKDPSGRFQLPEKIIGESAKFLKPNENVIALVWSDDDEEKIISIKLPVKMEFTVKDAPPSIKGNTANGGGKIVTLENGIKISVPFFVNTGDKIRINTETNEYVERVQ
ncbi:MAG TPA: elongation factor P [Candidatus Paceibacterota bacterium]|jgi:elongation factor P|nr:elongation factor P [Candidatus Paceibacterota bacterium]